MRHVSARRQPLDGTRIGQTRSAICRVQGAVAPMAGTGDVARPSPRSTPMSPSGGPRLSGTASGLGACAGTGSSLPIAAAGTARASRPRRRRATSRMRAIATSWAEHAAWMSPARLSMRSQDAVSTPASRRRQATSCTVSVASAMSPSAASLRSHDRVEIHCGAGGSAAGTCHFCGSDGASLHRHVEPADRFEHDGRVGIPVAARELGQKPTSARRLHHGRFDRAIVLFAQKRLARWRRHRFGSSTEEGRRNHDPVESPQGDRFSP